VCHHSQVLPPLPLPPLVDCCFLAPCKLFNGHHHHVMPPPSLPLLVDCFFLAPGTCGIISTSYWHHHCHHRLIVFLLVDKILVTIIATPCHHHHRWLIDFFCSLLLHGYHRHIVPPQSLPLLVDCCHLRPWQSHPTSCQHHRRLIVVFICSLPPHAKSHPMSCHHTNGLIVIFLAPRHFTPWPAHRMYCHHHHHHCQLIAVFLWLAT